MKAVPEVGGSSCEHRPNTLTPPAPPLPLPQKHTGGSGEVNALRPLTPTEIAKLRAEWPSVDGRTFLAWVEEAQAFYLANPRGYKCMVQCVRNALRRRMAFRSGGLKPQGDRRTLDAFRRLAE